MPTSTKHAAYFENAIGRITEHPEGYAFVLYYNVPRQLNDLRALLMHLGQLLLRRGWHRILVDMYSIQPLTEPEKAMLAKEWYGGVIARPQRICTAFIMAKDAVTRLSIREIQIYARKQNDSNAFQSLDEARAYLITC
ncbi:hypothetical protein [Hymenobacter volaticus]|uniref:STAS/SEC14 domain-containing protein n=1 Tax=Hymenobacter volaticus TaxID=2932254 RepID=A0ABY4GFX3_9BACT|nr:hypothetical protein [Hymenobacter volaticus]UOQ69868.1 hypothetical protein MUN86_30275 [Hymenobacter volaticus]